MGLFGKIKTKEIFRTVHLRMFLVDDQLDPKFFYYTFIYLFKSSTCFEHLRAHPQENKCMKTISGFKLMVPCIMI